MSLENQPGEIKSNEITPEEAEKARLEKIQSLLTRAIDQLEDNNDYGLYTLSPEDLGGYDAEMLEKSLNFLEKNGGPIPTKQDILTYGQARDAVLKLMETIPADHPDLDQMKRRANVKYRLADFIGNKLALLLHDRK